MRKNSVFSILSILVVISMLIPAGLVQAAMKIPAAVDVLSSFTLLHTNDFHGNLEPSSYPGMARLAYEVNAIRAANTVTPTLLMDGGDEMQGTLLSNMFKGESTIDVFNLMGYNAATFGNHEFDWGQSVLISRTQQADYPFVSTNIVLKDGADCASSGWTTPSFAKTWVTTTVGTDEKKLTIAIFGVTTQETPNITIASATEGLCFKDPAESIKQYYDTVKATVNPDVIVVLSHLGLLDGGYGYGFPVYGDQTLAQKLIDAGKPVDIIIGGHSHTNMSTEVVVGGKTHIAQARNAARNLGRFDVTVNKTTRAVTIKWQRIVIPVPPAGTLDPAVDARIAQWASDPWYQTEINRIVGYSNVLISKSNLNDNLMGKFVGDAVYNYLNTDSKPENDIDIFINNSGGVRSEVTADLYPPGYTGPYTLTHGILYSILPFGNQTVYGKLNGAQVLDLLTNGARVSTSASSPAGVAQVAGLKYKYYNYITGTTPWSWGVYDVTVYNRTTQAWEPLDANKTYTVATNEFLAPAGQDGYSAFKYIVDSNGKAGAVNYTMDDMLFEVESWVAANYTKDSPFDGVLDGRITRNGGDTYDPANTNLVVPITILHNNDAHGNLVKGTYPAYTQFATMVNNERALNPGRTLLLNGGDQIQGDLLSYYYRASYSGFAADGSVLPYTLLTNPMMAVMNALKYDAMTLGNHEFNFGPDVFVGTLSQAKFPILMANVTDDGSYGLSQVPVRPYVSLVVPIGDSRTPAKIAILGLGNHRVPSYELPSNIPGLTFLNPITTAEQYVPTLEERNDAVVALTHIGFTTNPASKDVDLNVDTNLAAQVSGIDAIVGSHSHTDPAKPDAPYKYLPAFVGNPDGTPVIINQALAFVNTLGEIYLGLLPDGSGGYKVVSRAGQFKKITVGDPEDAAIKAIVDPYNAYLQTYNNTVVGQTKAPIDARTAYVEETTGANLQADASVYELDKKGFNPDFHLSGAMRERNIASTMTATPDNPISVKVSDLFYLMSYENSLVTLRMNGPQIKAVLERSYYNFYNYKYVPAHGGISYYTTCFLDTQSGGKITYRDTHAEPDGNNVVSYEFDGKNVDFTDASKYYVVSSVNYLVAGACNYTVNGKSLWPIDQIIDDTQVYVRDAVIDYFKDLATIEPKVEGRIAMVDSPKLVATVSAEDESGDGKGQSGEVITYTIQVTNTGFIAANVVMTDVLPGAATYISGTLTVPTGFEGRFSATGLQAVASGGGKIFIQSTTPLAAGASATFTFAVTVNQLGPFGASLENQLLLSDQFVDYTSAPLVLTVVPPANRVFLPVTLQKTK